MSRSEPVIRLTLSREGREAVDAPVNGRGGAQSLLYGLKNVFDGVNSAEISQSMVGKIARMACNGKGGFQNRLKRILDTITQ